MAIKTYESEDARLKLPAILDNLMIGAESVIERDGKATAVVVHYAQGQAWRRQRTATLARIRRERTAGDDVTQEAVDAGLQERGLL
jgi:antitoxin (DNA-binding transcriptional repressor) of toxin-antitoxin stability system